MYIVRVGMKSAKLPRRSKAFCDNFSSRAFYIFTDRRVTSLLWWFRCWKAMHKTGSSSGTPGKGGKFFGRPLSLVRYLESQWWFPDRGCCWPGVVVITANWINAASINRPFSLVPNDPPKLHNFQSGFSPAFDSWRKREIFLLWHLVRSVTSDDDGICSKQLYN